MYRESLVLMGAEPWSQEEAGTLGLLARRLSLKRRRGLVAGHS